MALHAVDDLSDAYRATRAFLFPIEWGRWLRLALLSVFVAGTSGGGAPSGNVQMPFNGGTTPGQTPGGDLTMDQLGALLSQHLGVIALVALVGLLVLLVVQWLAATFEFAFLESLRTDEVRVRRYVSAFQGLGTRLFAFRLVFGLLTLLIVGTVLLLTLGPILAGVAPGGPLLVLLLVMPVLLVFGILGSIVYVFTTAFVAPIMLLENRGVISAWKRFWGVFKAAWKDFLVYLLVGLFLMIGIGIVVGIAMAVIGIAVALPVVAVLIAAGPLWAGLLAIPFAIVGIVAWALVQVPVQTYLRYWALLVLGDVEPELDLISEQRQAVRGETPS
ncbi:DUF7544 domain-containing protein [Halodesulfurarchaeum formicicum]|nr:hypothetical protein [Halodesulfurarchaeum formicicum]